MDCKGKSKKSGHSERLIQGRSQALGSRRRTLSRSLQVVGWGNKRADFTRLKCPHRGHWGPFSYFEPKLFVPGCGAGKSATIPVSNMPWQVTLAAIKTATGEQRWVLGPLLPHRTDYRTRYPLRTCSLHTDTNRLLLLSVRNTYVQRHRS